MTYTALEILSPTSALNGHHNNHCHGVVIVPPPPQSARWWSSPARPVTATPLIAHMVASSILPLAIVSPRVRLPLGAR